MFSCEFFQIFKNSFFREHLRTIASELKKLFFILNLLNDALHKKWSFPLKISSVNVTKSAGNCGFGHIYWRNP